MIPTFKISKIVNQVIKTRSPSFFLPEEEDEVDQDKLISLIERHLVEHFKGPVRKADISLEMWEYLHSQNVPESIRMQILLRIVGGNFPEDFGFQLVSSRENEYYLHEFYRENIENELLIQWTDQMVFDDHSIYTKEQIQERLDAFQPTEFVEADKLINHMRTFEYFQDKAPDFLGARETTKIVPLTQAGFTVLNKQRGWVFGSNF